MIFSLWSCNDAGMCNSFLEVIPLSQALSQIPHCNILSHSVFRRNEFVWRSNAAKNLVLPRDKDFLSRPIGDEKNPYLKLGEGLFRDVWDKG